MDYTFYDRTIPPYKPTRRGRPRPPRVVSFQAPGDMAITLERIASARNQSVSTIIREILTIALETPHVWTGEKYPDPE